MAASPEPQAVCPAVSVDVQNASADADVPGDDSIADCLRQALAQSGRALPAAVEIAVRIVDEQEMRALNRQYRQQDNPTNVLSFTAEPLDGLPPEAVQSLGDIVVCGAVLRSEAAAQGKALADHWAHMLVHGTLHLLGFDHVDAPGAAAMEALEARILAARGIANPYVGS